MNGTLLLFWLASCLLRLLAAYPTEAAINEPTMGAQTIEQRIGSMGARETVDAPYLIAAGQSPAGRLNDKIRTTLWRYVDQIQSQKQQQSKMDRNQVPHHHRQRKAPVSYPGAVDSLDDAGPGFGLSQWQILSSLIGPASSYDEPPTLSTATDSGSKPEASEAHHTITGLRQINQSGQKMIRNSQSVYMRQPPRFGKRSCPAAVARTNANYDMREEPHHIGGDTGDNQVSI